MRVLCCYGGEKVPLLDTDDAHRTEGGLFGRSAMTTFERLYIADPATHTEVKDPYYSWLYKCKQGAIDLDLGLSVGAAYAEYDKYKYRI